MTGNLPAPVRVASCGAGYFSQFHLHSWQRIHQAELVGVCDLDIVRAGQAHGNAYTDLSTMLIEQKPDLLDLVVPPQAQATSIDTALSHGIKWLICQKPFCNNIDQARAVTRAAEDAGATLVIHENFRFQPWYRTIKQAINNGLIGQLLQATFRLRTGDGQGPQAYLDRQPYFQRMPRFLVHETAVHWIDTFRFLLGSPTAVYADLRQVNPSIAGEDAGYLLFDHAGGVRVLFDGNRSLDHAATDCRKTLGEAAFEGTEGELRLSGDGSVHLRPFGSRATTQLLPADTSSQFGGDCVHHLQNHVISGLLHGSEIENVAGDYLQVIEIEQAIYASAEVGRKRSLDTT